MQKKGLGAYEEVREARRAGLRGLFEDRERNEWMRGLSEEEIQKTKDGYRRWIEDGPGAAATAETTINGGDNGAEGADGAASSGGNVDVVMSGA